jgi:hypothetical protein
MVRSAMGLGLLFEECVEIGEYDLLRVFEALI